MIELIISMIQFYFGIMLLFILMNGIIIAIALLCIKGFNLINKNKRREGEKNEPEEHEKI